MAKVWFSSQYFCHFGSMTAGLYRGMACLLFRGRDEPSFYRAEPFAANAAGASEEKHRPGMAGVFFCPILVPFFVAQAFMPGTKIAHAAAAQTSPIRRLRRRIGEVAMAICGDTLTTGINAWARENGKAMHSPRTSIAYFSPISFATVARSPPPKSRSPCGLDAGGRA